MKKFLWPLLVLIVLLSGFLYLIKNPQSSISQKLLPMIWFEKTLTWEVVSIANPASVFCLQNSGTSEIIEWTWWQYWVCHLSDWTTCEERAYFRWECPMVVVEETWIIETTWTASDTETNPVKQDVIVNQEGPITNTNEFSINDSKYEVSAESNGNIFDLTASALVENTDPKCTLIDPKTKAYQDKLTYYTNILNINKNIQTKTYLIKDKTLASKYQQNPSEYAWYWINIYIIPNKIGYTNKEDFIKDFTRYCSIRPWIPIAVSKSYLVFSDSCDNWAMEVLGCNEEIINDLQNKIILK